MAILGYDLWITLAMLFTTVLYLAVQLFLKDKVSSWMSRKAPNACILPFPANYQNRVSCKLSTLEEFYTVVFHEIFHVA